MSSSSGQKTTTPGKRTPFWVTFAAGGVAGTVGAVITCPLEVIKTRLQSSKFQLASAGPSVSMSTNGMGGAVAKPLMPFGIINHVYGTLTAVQKVAAEEGISALWKGVGATIVGVVPARAVYFSTYHKGKHLIAEGTGWGEADPRVHLTAAALAGATVCTATNPIWLVKTRMQLQHSGQPIKYVSSLDCLRTVIREEGVRGLYKGLAASYIGVAESTLQWVIYEHLKKGIAARNTLHHVNHVTPQEQQQHKNNNLIEYFGAAAGAKLIAAIIAYPHEVLRTRMREMGSNIKYRTVRQTFTCILREEGVGALYGGMTAHLMRVVPNSAIMFFCYELLIHAYDRFSVN